MTSVNSPQSLMPSSLPFLKEDCGSCMRIGDMTANRFASRSALGDTSQGSHGRSVDEDVLRRTGVGSWRRRTPGSIGFESFSSDMRSCLKAMRLSFISPLRLSVGGRWLLFTDKSLVLCYIVRLFLQVKSGRGMEAVIGTPLHIFQSDGNSHSRIRGVSIETGSNLL